MNALRDLLDRAAITRVVNDWALFRDTWRWDQLRGLYTHDATMHTTWFAGLASEFVDRSIESATRGSRSQHFIGAASIEINGDRAIAETRMILMLRAAVEDVAVDVTCYGRFFDRLVRDGQNWRIKARIPVYEKDRIDSVEPGRAVPIDPVKLGMFAEGYRHVAYVQSLAGATLTPGLPTARSEAEARLLAEGAAWLAG
jgi:hypothetical protein